MWLCAGYEKMSPEVINFTGEYIVNSVFIGSVRYVIRMQLMQLNPLVR